MVRSLLACGLLDGRSRVWVATVLEKWSPYPLSFVGLGLSYGSSSYWGNVCTSSSSRPLLRGSPMRYRTLIWSCLGSLFPYVYTNHMEKGYFSSSKGCSIWVESDGRIQSFDNRTEEAFSTTYKAILVAGISRTPVWDRRLSIERLFFWIF